MIFITDLDRTVVFSKRRFDNNIVTFDAEYREGNPVGFMTPNAYKYLKIIQKKTVFVANTLRGIDQAKRIVFVNDGGCSYVSAQNGLYLYHNGVLDNIWSGIVKRKVSETEYNLDTAIEKVLKSLSGIECMSKKYEYLAVFFADTENFDYNSYREMRNSIKNDGWELYIQGRKLYLSPLSIDKGTVLEYIKQNEDNVLCAGFGDSYFDIPMLRKCDVSYSLYKSEIYETITDKTDYVIKFSEKPDVLGSEEILNRFTNEFIL